MQQLAIYGAGGFGREIAVMIEQINAKKPQWDVIGFIDDRIAKGSSVDGLPVLGDHDFLNGATKQLAVVLAIAEPVVRKSIFEKIRNTNISFPSLIHPSANLGSKNNSFGNGTLITDRCTFTTNVALGRFVIVNLAVTIGHDVVLQDFAAVMPGAHISGQVNIGQSVLIGSGAVILQGITIGPNAKVGAGAVVTKDVPSAAVVVGVPAKTIR